jgi:hypothetical protein
LKERRFNALQLEVGHRYQQGAGEEEARVSEFVVWVTGMTELLL